MARTPESLVRHELVGLSVRVTAADNDDLVGLTGEVVAETTQMLGIETDSGRPADRPQASGADGDRVSHVPKDGTTFAFTLPGEADSASTRAGSSAHRVERDPRTEEDVSVEGRRLVARPARRTENTGAHTWR
jgi:ribonuclease P protein subunit POP4